MADTIWRGEKAAVNPGQEPGVVGRLIVTGPGNGSVCQQAVCSTESVSARERDDSKKIKGRTREGDS